ncbi:MAG: hypothetical protein U0Q16_27835 [Bryobacteraceae bacterium]
MSTLPNLATLETSAGTARNGSKPKSAGTMRIAMLLPDGVGVRNFVLGKFLERATDVAEVDVFHRVPDEALPSYTAHLGEAMDRVRWQPLQSFNPPRMTLALQYALGYAQMYWADTHSMRRLRDQLPKGKKTWQAFVRGSRFLGRLNASPKSMRRLEGVYCHEADRLPEVAHYRKLFEARRPSVLFSSNQIPSTTVPAVLAAKQLGIPTASFIFSWDNLSSKGRITAPFDHFLVWSDLMRRELLHYYPHVRREQIHVVGTPQFEPYSDKSLLWSRDEFFRKIGADPARKLICYSGGDTLTCPEDPGHLRVLLELIRSGRIPGNPQVILRPAPVDDGKRYLKVRQDFPELIVAQPEWLHSSSANWSLVFPTPQDVRFLVNVTHHCDMNVNMGSTMTLDFGIQDKPVVNIAFDISDPPYFGQTYWDYYYCFEHLQPVLEAKASRVARTKDQFAEHIAAYLKDPSLDREGRRKLADLEVGAPLEKSTELIVEALRRVARP